MAPPISDAVVVDVLRRVDRLLAPLVPPARPPAGPAAGRRATTGGPTGSSRVAAGLAAAPRFAGKLADLLPLQNTVGDGGPVARRPRAWPASTASSDPAERVSLLARVLLDRDLPAERVRAAAAAQPRAPTATTPSARASAGGAGARPHAVAGRPAARPDRRRPRRPPQGQAAPPRAGQPAGRRRGRRLRRRAGGAAPRGRGRPPTSLERHAVSAVAGTLRRQVRRTPHASPSTGSW